MKRSVILLFTLLGSCLGKVSTDTEYHRQLVVEGRIEAGGPAEVMLSENLPFLDVITEQTLEADNRIAAVRSRSRESDFFILNIE